MLLGKVDAFVYDKPFIQIFAKRNVGKVGALLENITAEDFGLAARKTDVDVITRFNSFLIKWKQSGEFDVAMKTHFETMPWLAEMDMSK